MDACETNGRHGPSLQTRLGGKPNTGGPVWVEHALRSGPHSGPPVLVCRRIWPSQCFVGRDGPKWIFERSQYSRKNMASQLTLGLKGPPGHRSPARATKIAIGQLSRPCPLRQIRAVSVLGGLGSHAICASPAQDFTRGGADCSCAPFAVCKARKAMQPAKNMKNVNLCILAPAS